MAFTPAGDWPATLAAHPRCNGKVGIVGFCMGGAMAFAAAGAVEGLVCAVPFYGLPRPDFFDPSKVKCPIQAHFAANDGWAVPDKAAAFRDGVNAHGGAMELHVYDAGHAFMREGDARVYDAASAAGQRASCAARCTKALASGARPAKNSPSARMASR